MAERWRGLLHILGFSFRVDRLRATLVVALAAVDMGAYAFFALWLKFLADGATGRDGRTALVGAIGMMATIAVNETANWIRYPLQETLRDRTALELDLQLMRLSGDIPTLEHHERSDYLRDLERLRAYRGRLTSSLSMVANNVGLAVRMAITAVLLASLDPLLLVLPLFAVPAVLIASRVQKWREAARDEVAEQERSAWSILGLATEPAPAKELRVFGLLPELVDRYRSLRETAASSYDRANRRATVAITCGWVFFSLGYIGAIAIVTMRAVRGEATPGDVLLSMNLAAQVTGQVSNIAYGVQWLQQQLEISKRYTWLVDYSASVRLPIADPAPPPGALREGIRLQNVTFRYPGTEGSVLSDVDLDLPAGATIAIVGDNGAGKTTLVKLLLGMYHPTSGTISVDGTDLRRFEPDAWLRRCAAGFQDFVNFELVARETVGVGDLPRISDDTAVLAALERASASDAMDSLPRGLDSQLGRRFDDGSDLSTGQWQKLALGRGMMREAPVLLVLDEPTAALDPMTEHALFERFTDATKRMAEMRGSVTILVSHRFSTVRMADLIVVLDDGKIAERGAHDELIAAEGLYAELYEIQASAYR